jgi:putative DNA primase/helicase
VAAHAPIVSWCDEDACRLQIWLTREWKLSLSIHRLEAIVAVVARRHPCHPPREWVASLKWDGVSRVDTWLSTYLGAADTAYARMVAGCFLRGAVARLFRPGCKLDTMVVLEGIEGTNKSTALRVLFGGPDEGGGWFSDTALDLQSKDRIVDLQGKWAVEIAELDSFTRADELRVKSFLSSAVDRLRMPFGRVSIDLPRQVIFCGTTNFAEYLRSEQNRRFFPVQCGVIDIEALKRDRDQLLAEARVMFEGGGTWWPDAAMLPAARDEQRQRVNRDAWQELVEDFLASPLVKIAGETTVRDVLGELGIEKGKWGQPEQNRVARCLRLAGWERVRRADPSGKRRWVYVDASASTETKEEEDIFRE